MSFDTNFKFDLSRLKRKQPDLKSVKAPRFLFDGWSIASSRTRLPAPYGVTVREEDFDSSCQAVFYPRGAHNDEERSTYSITVSYAPDAQAWTLRCTAYQWGPHAVPGLYDENASFETVVHAAELFLMGKLGDGIGDIYMRRPALTFGYILAVLRNKDEATGVAGNVGGR